MKKKIIILILIMLFLSLVLVFYTYNKSMIPFNHDVWVESNNIDDFYKREKMARYLLNEKLLIGKSIIEINQLLGETSNKQDGKNKVFYEISDKYENDIDPVATEYLIVYLDTEGKALKVEIRIIKINQE